MIKYNPDKHCQKVIALGKRGFAITDAGEKMGMRYQTLVRWEQRHPEFKEAFKGIRENSRKWKAYRVERMMQKSEAELEAMLMRLKVKRLARAEKNKAEFSKTE